jgi:hypothetical protein
MEAFFQRENRGITSGAYTNDASFMRAFGMELMEPLLVVESGSFYSFHRLARGSGVMTLLDHLCSSHLAPPPVAAS